MRDTISIGVALVAGVLLASYDLRTDDTGIEVGLLLLVPLILAALAPKRWWVIALCVGLPIPIVESVALHALPPAGAVALAVTIVGALIGFAIGRASRAGAAS